MKHLLISCVLIFSLLLSACVHRESPNLRPDLIRETWMHRVSTSPAGWTKGADSWFFTGDPNPAELSSLHAPYSAAISTMQVRVANRISKIRVDGAFQVQIFGTDEHNSLYLFGPNSGVRNIAVDVRGDTLVIRQTQFVPNMQRVIVRIGIRNLRELVQANCGSIEVLRVRSDHLKILALPLSSGNIYLTGCVNLNSIYQGGSGSINVIGAMAPNLTITTTGSGSVNVAGNVGIRSIIHHGASNINIVGANSNSLSIDADGMGQIGIRGLTCLHHVRAGGATRVYAYPVKADNLSAVVCDDAQVGIAGYVRNLHVETMNNGSFLGSNLCAQSVYAKTYDNSHINVTAYTKAFVSAYDKSSAYFYGPANLLTQFVDDEASVIPFERRTWCNANAEFRSYSYTMTHPGERLVMPYLVHKPVDYKGELA